MEYLELSEHGKRELEKRHRAGLVYRACAKKLDASFDDARATFFHRLVDSGYGTKRVSIDRYYYSIDKTNLDYIGLRTGCEFTAGSFAQLKKMFVDFAKEFAVEIKQEMDEEPSQAIALPDMLEVIEALRNVVATEGVFSDVRRLASEKLLKYLKQL